MSEKLTPAVVFSLQSAAKTANLSPGSPSGRDIVEKAAKAAWICRGLGRPYYLSARLRWGMDETVIRELNTTLFDYIAREAKRGRGPTTRIRELARLAIHETLHPGLYRYDVARIQVIGCRTPEWYRNVARDYKQVFETLERWTEVAAAHVWHRQR